MKYTLKHRLVGAAVLTAIAVILLPGFFKERKEFKVNTKSQIPAAPQLQAETYANPQPVPNIEPAPAPETMFAPQEPAEVGPASQPISSVSSVVNASVGSSSQAKSSVASSLVGNMPLNAQGLPEAWVVQVGSFTTKEAANKLRDELQAENIKAYVRTTPSGGGSISRVYVGPKLDKAQALQIKEQMDKRLKVKSMVMKFQP